MTLKRDQTSLAACASRITLKRPFLTFGVIFGFVPIHFIVNWIQRQQKSSEPATSRLTPSVPITENAQQHKASPCTGLTIQLCCLRRKAERVRTKLLIVLLRCLKASWPHTKNPASFNRKVFQFIISHFLEADGLPFTIATEDSSVT